MADIFISYASEDRERARGIAETLTARGWTVWWDRRILPGESFESVIERELASADCVIVLWSVASVGSHWTKAEADEALNRGVLVPALIDDVRIPIAFRHVQAASLVDWTPAMSGHTGFEMLVESIRRLDRPEAPASAAAPFQPFAAPPPREAAPMPLYGGAGAAASAGKASSRNAPVTSRPGKRVLLAGGAGLLAVMALIAANSLNGGGGIEVDDYSDPSYPVDDKSVDAPPASTIVSREPDALAAGYQTVIGWMEEWVPVGDTTEVYMTAEPGYTYYVYARTTPDCDADIHINENVQDIRVDADATVEFYVDVSSSIAIWFPVLSNDSASCLMGRGIYSTPRVAAS